MTKYAGLIEIPLFEAGYTLPLAGVSQQFNTSGLVPLVSDAWTGGGSTGADAPNSCIAFVPSVGGFTQILEGAANAPNGYGHGMWFNGNYLSFTSTGILQAARMDRNNFGVTGYQQMWTIPGNTVFGAPPAAPSLFPPASGELNAELKVGSWTNTNPVNPDPTAPVTNAQVIRYGGLKFLGYGFSDVDLGGDIGLFAGITPIINAQFVKGLGVTPDIARGFMYLPSNAFRPSNLLIRYPVQQYFAPDYTFRSGDYYNVAIEDGPLAGKSPALVSCYRNGWSMVFSDNDLSAPGAQWTWVVMDYDMLTYRILRVSAQTAAAEKVLKTGGTVADFKIDVDGILWAMGGATPGKMYTSFTARLDFAPAIYPVPPATFSLPCFNPCEPALWPPRS